MPEHLLITVSEVRKQRLQMYENQGKIDPIAKVEIPSDKIVLDHCHATDHCRAALHRQTNAALGKIENAYIRYIRPFFDISMREWLENTADYLDIDCTGNPYHSGWIKRVCTKFNALNARNKDKVLKELGAFESKSNDAKRKLAFKKILTSGIVTKWEVLEIIEHAKKS